jgi:hypothetical protein
VSFFEPPPRPPEPPYREQPEWLGPPDDVVGGTVALELVVGRSPDAAITLDSATAYPTGVELRVDVRWREGGSRVFEETMRWHSDPRQGKDLPDELVRFGVQLADGSKATTLGTGAVAPAVLGPGQPPAGPLLIPRAGGGGPSRWTQHLWLWPLAPEGAVEFVCEWPALGIELSRVAVAASLLRDAAARTRTLW